MRIKLAALKIGAVVLAAGIASACATTGINSNEPFQGKVWRAKITRQFLNTSETGPVSDEIRKKAKYNDEHERNRRLAQILFMDGQMIRFGFALVPDNLEFSDIEKGAIVDVFLEPGVTADFSTYRLNRILQLICRANDVGCIKGEKSAKRLNTIVDANTGDTFEKYGQTFNRRNTPEDIAKYK